MKCALLISKQALNYEVAGLLLVFHTGATEGRASR